MILRPHAKQRIRDRFNVKAGSEQVFFDRHFPKADRVTEVYNDRGNLTAHYITGDMIFVVDEAVNEVITVKSRLNKQDEPAQQSFKQRIQAFIKSEIERIKSAGDSQEKFASTLESDVIDELTDRYAELKRARSLPKKLALKGRIAALEERLNEIPTDIRQLRAEVRKQINGALAHY